MTQDTLSTPIANAPDDAALNDVAGGWQWFPRPEVLNTY